MIGGQSSADLPSRDELDAVFRDKYGDLNTAGWSPRRNRRFNYFQPSDVYEAAVKKAVFERCAWLDVGGGSTIFPQNAGLARTLASRAARVVAVDPSDNVLENRFVHERVQKLLDHYESAEPFDLATFRMVVEHVADPDRLMAALARLVRPGGTAIVFTVNLWSPITIVSRFSPFQFHHFVKKILWNVEEHDTFPVEYKMNSRETLARLFERHGFREAAFAYLDDLATFGGRKYLNYVELLSWRALRSVGLRYPENCLLGIYRRD